MKKVLIPVLIFLCNIAVSQTVIQMKREGGVSIVPCKVNGLKLSFIFDTGASDVTISLTEATFMLKNGYLSKNDIIGTSNYSDANGDISEGININLREIEIQGLKLYNVKAAIVKNLDAPLLLGQTAINKLGVIQLDLNSNTLIILSKNSTETVLRNNNSKINKCQDIDGNIYTTINIGNKKWMAENLGVTRFQNGDIIRHAKNPNEWEMAGKEGIPAWCYSMGSNGLIKEKLYNWYAVSDPRNIAPIGYHVSNEQDWIALEREIGLSESSINLTGFPRDWINNNNLNDRGSSINAGLKLLNYGFSLSKVGARLYHGVYCCFDERDDFWLGNSGYGLENGILQWAETRIIEKQNILRTGFPTSTGKSVRCVKN
jgi:uncharacterized protein (TIGR02145 family)